MVALPLIHFNVFEPKRNLNHIFDTLNKLTDYKKESCLWQALCKYRTEVLPVFMMNKPISFFT